MNVRIASAFLTIALVSQGWAATRALLVGIDKYPDGIPSLRGCVNDVNRFKSVLTQSCGVPAGSIRTLTDSQATRAGIMAAFEKQLVNGVKAEDSVIFYFSGHGSHTPDLNGDERDGEDEALCPYDIDSKRPDTWLTDDVVRHMLSRVPTSNVLVVLDCCHSGTAVRQKETPEFTDTRGLRIGFKTKTKQNADSKFFRRARSSAKQYVLAAAGPDQMANEINAARFARLGLPERQSAGVLTYSLCEELKAKPNQTFGELRRSVGKRVTSIVGKLRKMSRTAVKQEAQFELANSGMKFGAFVRGEAGVASAQVRSSGNRGISVSLVPEGDDSATAAVSESGVVTTGDINLNLSTNQRVFNAGDQLVVTVKPDRDCYLRLYYKSAEGAMMQIFPNAGKTANFIKAGEEVQLPGAGDKFKFTMGEPFGSEILKAVASSQQFTDLHDKRWAAGLFEPVEETRIHSLSTRGIKVEVEAVEKPVRGEATLIYEVRD